MSKIIGAGAFPTPHVDDVVGWERASYSLGGRAPRYNPDSLVRTQGLKVFELMRNDEQVKAVMQFRRDAIMGRGWQLSYDEGTQLEPDEQRERIRVMTACLRLGMEGSFEDGLNCIWTARDYGFSLTEKIFTNVKVPGDMTRVGLRMLLRRWQTDFEFITDDYGMLEKCVQKVNGKQQEIDLSRFIYFVQNPEWDRYWGRSELREAYRPWYIKQRMDDYYALYLERFAGGFMILTQDATSNLTPNSPTYRKLEDVLTNMHGASGIILPKGVTAELLFPPSNDAFEKAVTAKDLAIAKACLVPNLLGLSHTGQTGSFSQSQTQLEAFVWSLNTDGSRMCAALDRQLVYQLGEQNWGDGEYPCFSFKPASIEHIKYVIDTWQKLTAAGDVIATEKDEEYIRGLLNMPRRDEDDQALTHPADAAEQNLANTADERAGALQGHTMDLATRESDRADKQQAIDARLRDREIRVKAAKAKKTGYVFDPNEARDENGKWADTAVNAGKGVAALDRAMGVHEANDHHAVPPFKLAKGVDNETAADVVEQGLEYGRDRRVKLSDLYATQDFVDRDVVGKMLKSWKPEGDAPTVARIDGKLYIADGHHRLAAAKFGGAKEVTVKVFGPRGRNDFVPAPHGTMSVERSVFYAAASRVMFTAIKERQGATEAHLVEASAQLVAQAVQRALGTDEQIQNILERGDGAEDVTDVEFGSADLRKLQGIMKSGLGDAWRTGLEHARAEVDGANFKAKREKRTAYADLRDKAASFLQAKSFRMAGDLSEGTRDVIQQELLNAIKSGRSVSDTREAIWARIVDKGYTTRTWARDAVGDDANVQRGLDRLWVDSEEEAAHYLETLARTSMYEALNEARMAEFMDPALSGFVVAIEYSAILDARTSDLCEELNGQIHPVDSDFWDTFRPPNHFNCRSIPLAITEADGDWIESEVPDDLEPQPGFK